jgi:hypothetical protein
MRFLSTYLNKCRNYEGPSQENRTILYPNEKQNQADARDRTGWSSGNALDSYYGGARFEFQSGLMLFRLMIFVIFPITSQKIVE